MCHCKRTVLVVDNLQDTLDLIKEALEDDGYKVFTAKTARKAMSIAKTELIHLAVVDVRLRHERSETDFSGLHLAAALPEEMRKIIMTGKRWHDRARVLDRVLERDEQRRLKYCDFIEGSEYRAEHILSSINHAFSNNLPFIRMNLKLKLEPNLAWQTMVRQMKETHWETVKAASNGFAPLEPIRLLQELSCLLFSSSHQKPNLVKFISTTPGYSPCTVAMVRPYFESGPGLELAAKFGPSHSIEIESANFENYVLPYIPNHSRTDIEYGPVYLQKTGALAYDFIGQDGQDVKTVKTLREHYGNPQVSDEDLCKTLTYLFSETCARWYRQRDRVVVKQRQRLDVFYRSQLHLQTSEHMNKLNDAFRSLLNRSRSSVVFKLLRNGSLQVELKGRLNLANEKLRLPDPIKFCLETRNSIQNRKGKLKHPNFFPILDQYAITHGDLHSGNVIVNKQGAAWLIDFYKTGVGHALRDFAELESDIKFTLFTGKVSARYELERALLRPKSLNESLYIEKPSQSQQRALSAIQTIRQLAFELTDIESTKEYYMALLFYALKSIRGFTSGSSNGQSYNPARTHALLSAALLCQRLSSTDSEKLGAVFLAHDYRPAYRKLIQSNLSAYIKRLGFDAVHPLEDQGGNIWLRVAEMIEESDAGFYEISTGNGNVYFELGYGLGKQKPYFALIHKKSKLKRPSLLGGDLLYEYSGEQRLKAHVKGILNQKDKWEDRFTFLRPAFKTKLARVREQNKSVVLLVANTHRQQNELAPLLKNIMERIHQRSVEVISVDQQVNIEQFLLRLRKAQFVVGCLASDRSVKSPDTNAELALALGIAKGMGKKTIILQERNCEVLTDLMSFTVTFRGLNGAVEALDAEINKALPGLRRASKNETGRARTKTAHVS
jgi:CheY-like chemotaxis protein